MRTRGHTDWCAGGHRCNSGEHRADPLAVDVDGVHLVLTRILGRDGRQHVELRAGAVLAADDRVARVQLVRLVDRLVRVLARPRR